MTKKMNTILFIAVGTLVNLLLSLSFILLFIVLFALLTPYVGEKAAASMIPLVLVGGVLLGMITYQKLSRFVVKKYNLEDKMEPLIKRRINKKKLE